MCTSLIPTGVEKNKTALCFIILEVVRPKVIRESSCSLAVRDLRVTFFCLFVSITFFGRVRICAAFLKEPLFEKLVFGKQQESIITFLT